MDLLPEPLPPDVDHGSGLVVAAWTMGFVGCSLLGMRMYTRAVIIKKIGWDDWIMVIAVVSLMELLTYIHSTNNMSPY